MTTDKKQPVRRGTRDERAPEVQKIKIPPAQQSLLQSFRAVAKTSHGRRVFRHLMQECGFKESSIVASHITGVIDPVGTVHDAAIRNVYLRIRPYIPVEFLNQIEAETEKDDDNES